MIFVLRRRCFTFCSCLKLMGSNANLSNRDRSVSVFAEALRFLNFSFTAQEKFKAIPRNSKRYIVLGIFSSECSEISQAYWRMARDFWVV